MGKVHRLVCVICEREFTWEWGNPNRGRIPVRCDVCRTRDPKGRELNKHYERIRQDESPTRVSAGRLNEGDKGELEFIQNRMGLGQAEAIKTAIRVYAAILRKGP